LRIILSRRGRRPCGSPLLAAGGSANPPAGIHGLSLDTYIFLRRTL
jgi:hypothetical protein